MKPMDRQRVPEQQLGRLRDFTKPQIEAANAQRSYTEIANFMEGALGVAKPIYEEWVNGQIKEELAKVASDPSFIDRYRDGDETTRAYARSMRPQARRVVEGYAADAGITEFNNGVVTEAANNPVLSDPNSTDQERAVARSEIISKYQQKYLDVLPPEALAPRLGDIETAKATMRGKALEIRIKQKDVQDKAAVRAGLTSTLLTDLDFDTAFDTQSAGLDAELQTSQKEAIVKLRADTWTSRLDGLSENYNPTEVGELYTRSVIQAALRLQADGKVDDAQLLVAQARRTAEGYSFDSGGNLLSVSVGKEGQSVGELLNKQIISLEKLADKAESKYFFRDNASLIFRAGDRSLSEAERLEAKQALLLAGQGQPQVVAQALATANNLYERTKPALTDAQQLQYRDLLFQVRDSRTPIDQRSQAIIQSGLPPEYQTDLASRMTMATAGDPVDEVIRARQNMRPELIDSLGRIKRSQADAIASRGANAVAQLPDDGTLLNEIQIKASEATLARIEKEQAEPGAKALEPGRVKEIFAEEIDNAEVMTIKQYNLVRDSNAVNTPADQQTSRLIEDLGYIRNQVVTGEAQKGDLKLFPPSFLQSLPPEKQNYEDARDELQKRAVNIKLPNGRSVFPNFSQIWQKTLRGDDITGGQPEATSSSTPQDRVNRRGTGVGPRSEQVDDQASIGQQLEGVLGQLLNVVIPAAPANAGELDGKKESDYTGMQTAEMLSAAMRRPGSVDLGPSTPGLPQQGAAAVTARPVPTSINSPNHPYFVAIGLNEGTRTSDGGYTNAYYGHTDPGDGAANRGTISARSGSPQQADRMWAGILSGRAIEVRQALRNAGLADNTVGFQRVMFNVLDLMVQVGEYSGANDDFLGKLPDMQAAGFTIESVAKARTDSYINPSTGRLEAAGFGNSYNRLFQDQRRRAGTFDYKKRL